MLVVLLEFMAELVLKVVTFAIPTFVYMVCDCGAYTFFGAYGL
jgi:hypothetical protein